MVLNQVLQLTGDFNRDWQILEREIYLLMSEYSRLTFIAQEYPAHVPDEVPSEVATHYTFVANEIILPIIRQVQEFCRTELHLDEESYEDLCGDWLESLTLYSSESNESFEEKIENLEHNYGYAAITYLKTIEVPLRTYLNTGEVTNIPGCNYGILVFRPFFTHLGKLLEEAEIDHDKEKLSLNEIYELLNC